MSNAQRSFAGTRILGSARSLPRPALSQSPWLGVALRVCLVGVAYYASARVGLLLAFGHSNVSPVWPPSGIAVAALLILGRRYWPALALAAFLVNLTTGLPPAVSTILAAGNTGEYVLAAYLLQTNGFDDNLRRIRDLVLLIGLGAVASTLLAATVGTTGLLVGGVIPSSAVATVAPLYWIGDAMGILVFTPLILAWRGVSVPRWDPARWIEAAALALVSVVASGLVFGGVAKRAYGLFPMVLWAALRFGQRGATATAVVVSAVAIWGTAHGLGPFNPGSETDRLTNLQVYVAAFTMTGLILGAAVLARRDTERRLRERSDQLESTNAELEAFAYTVSHDLRAPLRAINGFSTALLTADTHQLSDESNQYLGRIAENASHMGSLIDALLSFARLGKQPLNRHLVSPTAVARRALDRLQIDLPDGLVTIDEMPACSADALLLGQVYQNLLDNAVKFTRGREAPRIEAGSKPGPEDQQGPIYYVRDNGVGFDMRYSGKLFGVFQRLHRHAEFPGTGAGLAIARRIVIRHGGRIWAEATPKQGATFFFTLGPDGAGS